MRYPAVILMGIMLFAFSLSARAEEARIVVNTDRVIDEIDPMIYGNFIEHLGRCIYGGIYEENSPLSDEQGFRKDVLRATKELSVTNVRYPGGNFVSGYHWEDGIGPKEGRPVRMELAWNARESNRFGTDEFIDWCRKAGVEPYICVNMGTGTLDEARYWVEYCNIDGGTYYSDLRKKNGHDVPHKVKYWGLGNEIDGPWQMGHKNAEDYGKFALEAAKLMKWTDPEIKLIASGSSYFVGDWVDWNRTVLKYLRNHVDYISLHTYVGNRDNDYYEFMSQSMNVEKRIKILEGIIREVLHDKPEKKIYIAYDEWNVWYRASGEEGIEERYNLEDALVVASFLNAFVRNAHIVKIANLAQLVNVIAPIYTSKEGQFLQTTYYPIALFARHCRVKSIQPVVQCESYEKGEFKSVPLLDVSASYSDGYLVLNVLNRSMDKPIDTKIESGPGNFGAAGEVYEVNGPALNSINSFEETNVGIAQKSVTASGKEFRYTFPPHSFTLIKIKLL